MARIYYWIGCTACFLSGILDHLAFAFADVYQWAMKKSVESDIHDKIWHKPIEEDYDDGDL